MTKAGFRTTLLPTLLLLLVLIVGCAKPRVAGKWKGAAKTPGETMSTAIEFKPDGTMTRATKTPAGAVSATGTYTVAGNKLNMHVDKVTTTTTAGTVIGQMSQDQVATVKVEGDTLSLTQNGRIAQFTRGTE
jgi:uncharacterized protein (TIGR03066 family)